MQMKVCDQHFNIFLRGEEGKGGRPRVRDNPYLKIDMLNPNEPILFEGELQKYKPGFTATFIDRWL